MKQLVIVLAMICGLLALAACQTENHYVTVEPRRVAPRPVPRKAPSKTVIEETEQTETIQKEGTIVD